MRHFWVEAFSWRGSASGRVVPTAAMFGLFAALISVVDTYSSVDLAIEVGPHEVAGVLLSLMLVTRTNAGYERWWEARKLWGGIVNQTRNLALIALAHGPGERRWREQIIRWIDAFPYVAKARLRGEKDIPEVVALLGEEEAARVRAAEHMPSYVALRIAHLLREAHERLGMDRFAFLQAERERCGLIDNLGGCERIQNTPLATVYSITIRRFILIYLATIPFALLHKFRGGFEQGTDWLSPVVTFLLAYPVLTLDLLGVELQRPFSTRSLNHLPLNDICHSIEKTLRGLLEEMDGRTHAEIPSTDGILSEGEIVSFTTQRASVKPAEAETGNEGAHSGPG
jgi:putative membrane protein